MLVPPQPDIPLIIYLTTTKLQWAVLAQKIEGEERAIYYFSKKSLEYETQCSPLEKTILALV